MTQKENQSFLDFANDVQNKNSLLLGTDSHLPEAHIRNRIEAGMDRTLSTRSRTSDKNIHKITLFKAWLDALKELDTQLQANHAERRTELEAITQKICAKSCDDRALLEPSHKSNTAASNPTRTNSKDYPPKLTREEGQLLVNNKGCTKCRKVYVFHTKDDNLPKDKCDFPKGTGYQPVTQVVVDTARHTYESRKGKRAVAAITSANLTSYASINSPSPTRNVDAGPSVHPVAAVMGYASNPVGYIGNYSSSVLSDEEGEETASDVHTPCATFIEPLHEPTHGPAHTVLMGFPLKVPNDPSCPTLCSPFILVGLCLCP